MISTTHIQRSLLGATFFFFFALTTSRVACQSDLPDKYPSADKVKVLDDFPKEGRNTKGGKGFSANVELLTNGVKKVALVSFFAFDPGVTKTWTNTSTSGTMTTTTTYTKKRSTGGMAGDIAYGAFVTSIDPMIAEFKALGIDLLLPDQFLDTEAKRNYYNAYVVPHEKASDFFRNLSGNDHDKMYGTLEGFNVMDIVDEPYANYETSGMLAVRKEMVTDDQIYVFNKDTKMTESLGNDLCANLGVDAVVVTYMTIFMPSNTKIKLQNVRFVMFGPNPVMPEVSQGGMIPHVKGEFYCGYSVIPDVLIYNESKKDPESKNLNFEGFDKIYMAIVREMGSYLKGK